MHGKPFCIAMAVWISRWSRSGFAVSMTMPSKYSLPFISNALRNVGMMPLPPSMPALLDMRIFVSPVFTLNLNSMPPALLPSGSPRYMCPAYIVCMRFFAASADMPMLDAMPWFRIACTPRPPYMVPMYTQSPCDAAA